MKKTTAEAPKVVSLKLWDFHSFQKRESEYGGEKGEYFLRKKQISTINFRILDIFPMILDYIKF